MNKKIIKRLTKLVEAINESDSPDQSLFFSFVELTKNGIGITPNYVVEREEPNANVLGVYLSIQCGDMTVDSEILPTTRPLMTA